jgi:hypothetical protein
MPSAELDNKFRFHEKSRVVFAAEHERIRTGLGDMARLVTEVVPAGREQALALTKLEEAMFWANAGIARAVD